MPTLPHGVIALSGRPRQRDRGYAEFPSRIPPLLILSSWFHSENPRARNHARSQRRRNEQSQRKRRKLYEILGIWSERRAADVLVFGGRLWPNSATAYRHTTPIALPVRLIPTQYQQFRPLADRAPSRYRGPRQTTRGRAARIVGGATGVPDLGFRLRPIFTGVR